MENLKLTKGEKVAASFFVSEDNNYKGEIYFSGIVLKLFKHSFDMQIENIERCTNYFSDEDIDEQFGGIGGIVRCYKHQKSHNGTKYKIVQSQFE